MTAKQYIYQDLRMCYYPSLSKGALMDWLLKSEQYFLRKYVRLLRAQEYYAYIKPNKLLYMYYTNRKNILGAKLGFFIPAGCFGPDLKIAHYGSIIVNPNSKIGRGCTIHGNCCIGNKGLEASDGDSPTIGDNVNIGQGAQVLGPVKVADSVIIAAGAIVNKNILSSGIVVAGVPAKEHSL